MTAPLNRQPGCAAKWLDLRAEYQKAMEEFESATAVVAGRLRARQAPTKDELKAEAQAQRRLACLRMQLVDHIPSTD